VGDAAPAFAPPAAHSGDLPAPALAAPYPELVLQPF